MIGHFCRQKIAVLCKIPGISCMCINYCITAKQHMDTGELFFQLYKKMDYFSTCTIWFNVVISSCFPFYFSSWEITPLCHWPFCDSHWHCWPVTSHPLPSAACLLPLSLCLPVHAFCIAASTLCVSCQLCFTVLSLLASPNHTFSNVLSVCFPHLLLCSPLLLSLSHSTILLVWCLWQFYITFIPKICCPSQILPIIPCMVDASPSPPACPQQQPE